jgi:hypothetical protein
MSLSATRFATVLAITGATTLIVTLSACATSTETMPTPTSTIPAATSSAEPSASATAAPSGVAVTINCDQLISAQAMYDYNPNFVLDVGYVPAAGSLASRASEFQGLACAWINETSGERIVVAVAQPDADALAQVGNDLVSSSNSVPTYTVEGYFQTNGTTGEAEAISTPYWITASSTAFLEPGDAAPIIAAARAGLGQ